MNLLLQITPRRARSSGDCGKAPTIFPFQVDSSSSKDNTILANMQVAQTIRRHFDRGGDDTTFAKGHTHSTSQQELTFSGNSQCLNSIPH